MESYMGTFKEEYYQAETEDDKVMQEQIKEILFAEGWVLHYNTKMNEAAEILLTYTNFKCFSRSNTDVNTYNCDVTRAEWIQKKQLLVFHISANRFLRNMVRAIVGTMLEVGLGKTTIEEFKQIIEDKDRCNAGPSAPPQGLFLTRVTYPKTVFIHE